MRFANSLAPLPVHAPGRVIKFCSALWSLVNLNGKVGRPCSLHTEHADPRSAVRVVGGRAGGLGGRVGGPAGARISLPVRCMRAVG